MPVFFFFFLRRGVGGENKYRCVCVCERREQGGGNREQGIGNRETGRIRGEEREGG